jgi:hypothetical protein
VYRSKIAAFATHPGVRIGLLAAARAARAHLADVANLEPLALLVVVPLLGARRSRAAAAVAATIGIQLALDLLAVGHEGLPDHPALGAALPLEHALLGVAVVALFPGPRAVAAATGTMALSLAGFALHTAHAHKAWATADLGRPHFEPDVAREANVTHGLLFFDDDQGFQLASDPGITASHGLQAARARGDDHDRLLYDLLGHPPTHRYVAGGATASINVWTPPSGAGDTWRYEAESDWPPALVRGGRVAIVEGSGMCSADARALSLEPGGPGEASMAVELPAPRGSRRTWAVVPRVFVRGGTGQATMILAESPDAPPLAEWTWKDEANGPGCIEIPERVVTLQADTRPTWLFITARGGPVALDRTTLRPR